MNQLFFNREGPRAEHSFEAIGIKPAMCQTGSTANGIRARTVVPHDDLTPTGGTRAKRISRHKPTGVVGRIEPFEEDRAVGPFWRIGRDIGTARCGLQTILKLTFQCGFQGAQLGQLRINPVGWIDERMLMP